MRVRGVSQHDENSEELQNTHLDGEQGLPACTVNGVLELLAGARDPVCVCTWVGYHPSRAVEAEAPTRVQKAAHTRSERLHEREEGSIEDEKGGEEAETAMQSEAKVGGMMAGGMFGAGAV